MGDRLEVRDGLIVNLHELRRWYRLFHPMVASIVIVRDAQRDTCNLMPAVWVYPISAREPYIAVGVAPERHTYKLMSEEELFGVSILPSEMYDLVRKLGDVSGAEVDKVKAFGLELETLEGERVPHLKGSLAWLEARKEEVISRGGWDHSLFIGRVLSVKVRVDAFDAQELVWKVDEGKVPVTWLGGKVFAVVTGKAIAEGLR